MGFNSQAELGPFGNQVVDVTSYGARGDGVTDDRAAIQAAIDAVPSGSWIIFPRGRFMIGAPLNITKTVRLSGIYERDGGVSSGGTQIRCMSTFSGSQMVRNWTDADYAAGNDGNRPNDIAVGNRTFWAAIERMMFDTGGKTNISCIDWVHMQETSYIRDVSFTGSGTGCSAVRLFANNEGNTIGAQLARITVYGSNWKHELYVKDNYGASVHVSDWVTTTGLHSDSPFYFENLSNVAMEFIQNSCWLDSSAPADAAQYRLKNVKGFTLSDSVHGLGVSCPRPWIRATNSLGGNGITSPVVWGCHFDVPVSGFTGNFIEDDTMSGATRTIALAQPVQLNYYDGNFWSHCIDGSSSVLETLRIVKAAGGLRVAQSLSGQPSITFEGDTDTGILRTAGTGDQLVLRAGGGSQLILEEPGTDQTGLIVRVNDGGSITVDRVSIGAADSGGSGFRVLRVPN